MTRSARRNPGRDFRAEARQVVHAAGKSREFPAAASVVRGAVNNAYEVLAEDLLRRTAERAAQMGYTDAQHREITTAQILVMASEAAMRVLREEGHGKKKIKVRIPLANPHGKSVKLKWSRVHGAILAEPAWHARSRTGHLLRIERFAYRGGDLGYRVFLRPSAGSFGEGVTEPVATRATLNEAKRVAQATADRMETHRIKESP